MVKRHRLGLRPATCRVVRDCTFAERRLVTAFVCILMADNHEGTICMGWHAFAARTWHACSRSLNMFPATLYSPPPLDVCAHDGSLFALEKHTTERQAI